MTDDIVERLAAEFAPENDRQIVLSTTVNADLLRDAKAEIERLRAAGDNLSAGVEVALHPLLADAPLDLSWLLYNWQEARRER